MSLLNPTEFRRTTEPQWVQETVPQQPPPSSPRQPGAERQDAVRSFDGDAIPWSAPAGSWSDRSVPGNCQARCLALGHASVTLDDNVLAGGACDGSWRDARGGRPVWGVAVVRAATTRIAAAGVGRGARGGRVDAGPRDAAREVAAKDGASCQAQVQLRPHDSHGSRAWHGEDVPGGWALMVSVVMQEGLAAQHGYGSHQARAHQDNSWQGQSGEFLLNNPRHFL